MQTFLPVACFKSSAQMLDYRRLNKQRVECRQLVNALTTEGAGWANHPAARMWERNITALMRYHDICIKEWVDRGYQNTMPLYGVTAYTLPDWFGDDKFHSRHRAALLAKDLTFYRRYDWREKPEINYLWPVRH